MSLDGGHGPQRRKDANPERVSVCTKNAFAVSVQSSTELKNPFGVTFAPLRSLSYVEGRLWLFASWLLPRGFNKLNAFSVLPGLKCKHIHSFGKAAEIHADFLSACGSRNAFRIDNLSKHILNCT